MEALADKRQHHEYYITESTGRAVPACLLFSGSLVLFFRAKTFSSLVQLLGAAYLVLVVLTHVSEALPSFLDASELEHSVGQATRLTTTPFDRRTPASAFSKALSNSLSGEGPSLLGSRPTVQLGTEGLKADPARSLPRPARPTQALRSPLDHGFLA